MGVRLVSLGLILGLTACASTPSRVENPAVELAVAGNMPAPTSNDMQYGLRQTFINVGDLLTVEVFGVEELTRELRVDNSGAIDFPLIGSLRAAGLSPRELGGVVEARLRGPYVRDPQVSVNIKEAFGQTLTIDGMVNNPGNYQIVADMTLMRAIAAAGGLDENADKDDVIIFRNVNGQRLAGLYNLAHIRVGNDPDPALYPNDIVVVNGSEDFLGKLTEILLPLTPITLAVDRLSN